ncbi:MAG: glycine cleavage system aminomethyltransferase GcvT [Burkholderiales bacterium]|nr:glycine cleavage system aminomethyltransferase GcvT [Burkholderiales bacterium]
MQKRTPLNEVHRAAGARMVDFGGYDMPVHYGSQIDEHHAVRRDAGMFDVSHMRTVDITGRGVRDFLRFALANNVDKLATPGKALYSCMLREDGGVLDDLLVYFLREDLFRLVVNAGTAEKDVAWLRALAVTRAPQLTITVRDDLAMIAVQGPRARALLWHALPGTEAATAALEPFNGTDAETPFGSIFVARTGYTGEDGFEILLPAEQAVAVWEALRAAGVRPAGLGARDTLRLEAGLDLYGQDMDETVSPFAAGLGWTVDLKSPRDFVGKAALANDARPFAFVGLVLTDTGGVLRAHQKVVTARGEGETTSGSFSPTLGKSIALARVPAGTAPGDTVTVLIRDKQLAARVVKPPFVRHGKVLVT